MSYGFTGKLLRINLSDCKYQIEEKDEEYYRKYLGGRNIAADIMLKEIPDDIDPFDSKNKLIITTSIITGTPIPGSSRFTVAAKSPLTEGFGESQAGGWWGPELKFAGYDGIIVEGQAEEPVYIYITNNTVEIKDATRLWGKETGEVQELIRNEVGDEKVRVLQCGPGGENLVRYAGITNELKHWNGRNGLGAVMGSKNLRAIAVRGNGKVEMKNREKVMSFVREFAQSIADDPALSGKRDYGTAQGVNVLNEMGLLPTENFSKGSFVNAEKISGEEMAESILIKNEACYACPVRCKRVVEYQDENISIDKKYGGPEYETIDSLGANCGIDDLKIIAKANELCGRYGIDTISTGVTIAFAMECFEKGIITTEDTEGIKLEFGNGQALLKMINKIANRDGFGDLLAEGSYRAAEKIGKESKQLSVSVKKQESPAHEPRGKWGVGLGYAISPTGADHLVAQHDSLFEVDVSDLHFFGIRETEPATTLSNEKVRIFAHAQLIWDLWDVLDLCLLVIQPETSVMKVEDVKDLINYVTGWDLSMWELYKASEKGINLARLFNIKHGITAKEDKLPVRFFEPIENGSYEGTAICREEFENALQTYYQLRGWDEDGVPTHGKLIELGLGNFINLEVH